MFVDIYHDSKNNVMLVSERVNGQRVIKRHQPDFFFYFEDPAGVYKSTSGIKCSKYETGNFSAYKQEVASIQSTGRKTFEADVKPIMKSLEQFYKGTAEPTLNVALWDIEVDFDPLRGYSSTDEAFMPITAISVYQSWTKQLHTVVLKPKLMKEIDARQIANKFENTILCESESQLLDIFLNLIEDADVFSGWNSTAFDVPYTVHRIQKVRGKADTARMSLWKQYPRQKEFEKYGEIVHSYEFSGRLHLDYLELYRKYTYHELPSYRLDYVGQIEVGETKTQYSGTLDQLYNDDFEKFIEYSRQDVELLRKIDEKNKFIDLVNFIAHENLVPLPIVMGAVALSDNAIILEAHNRNMVVPSRIRSFDNEEEAKDTQIAGAFVLTPVPGMYDWVASVDINSLYPSTFRALNMSPETIIGQVRQDLTESQTSHKKSKGNKGLTNTDKWAGVFQVAEIVEIQKQSSVELTLDLDDGTKQNLTAAQIWSKIKANNWLISANGTIFRTDIDGIIPGLLARWYAERKEYQAKKKELQESLTTTHDLVKVKQEIDYWDKRQYVVKIMLNSLYGAVTNAGSRFFDQRMGQSCTLTGRCITRHMMSKLNEILTGNYEFGNVIAYGDTDSAFITLKPVIDVLKQNGFEITKESFVELADSVTDEVNTTFADFLHKNYNVPLENGEVIKCGREICATRAMFVKKKRYAALVYDKEGKRKDTNGSPGEIKIMGMETERSDTPEWVQSKLEEMLIMVLDKYNEDATVDFIKEMRKEFAELKAWEQGSPKRVNNLKHYHDVVVFKNGKDENGKTITVPGHVRASLNWNKLREVNTDVNSIRIIDGSKIIVCKLKNNPFGMTSIAYPIDQMNLPEWFTSLPFDTELMVEGIIDQKVENIIGVLNWDLSRSKEGAVLENLFEWG